MVSFRAMQTSLSRRHRQRRLADRRRPRGSGPVKYAAIALPLFLFATLLMLGAAGATFAVAGYSYLAKDLPDPRSALEAITFDQQSSIYDRTGKVLLAKLGSDRRELTAFKDVPEELVDATTSIEDKTFWENSGFDPVGFMSAAIDTIQGNDRGGSTITQQLVRNRLLPASAFADSVYERKAREIIQSIRLTEEYPGAEGKQAIMEAYLNNNFYGNRSYGVAAAADTYWNKDLKDLTLAQYALLAAIPKSPTNYDLVSNSEEETYTDEDGKEQVRLVVPQNAAVVTRRNQVLEDMKTRSVLTKGKYANADYEAAKAEPVVLASQASEKWRAPHFVWKAREELKALICGDEPQCDKLDTGGYKVFSTLDYGMQRITEKWVYAAAIIPNSKNPDATLKARGIPRSEWGWIKKLRGHNIHNAAAGVVDYRTGEVLSYAGSASYTGKKSLRFQPQFDVLGDGWRQPGSSLKPLVYLIGIDDKAMTASTMFMDVVTNFNPGGKAFYPTQADGLERGPVRLRNALQFSLNIPAIKAGFINGLDHQFQRTKEFGLSYLKGTSAVPSESIGTLDTHPIDMITAFGTIANGGLKMPRHTILKVLDSNDNQVWPQKDTTPKGERVVSKQAAYIMTDILAGNTIKSVNPFWAKWKVTDGVNGGRTRPAAYKTGTTSDNKDVHAYGYLAPPSDKEEPGLVAGVWMGNSDSTPNDGKLSLDTSAPLWSAILSDVSKGMKIEGFSRVKPKGLVTATVDAFTGMRPGGSTRKTVKELFLPGTEPKKASDVGITADIDQASGLLWREGCVGPMVTGSFVNYSGVEAGFKSWQKANAGWQARAARGPGVSGGPKRTRTSYFYGGGFYPFGQSWGGKFKPTKKCPIGPPPPSICVSTDPASPCPSVPPDPAVTPAPGAGGGNGGGKPTPKPKP
jgi:membrane peptidoglycan carboxypeptidase